MNDRTNARKLAGLAAIAALMLGLAACQRSEQAAAPREIVPTPSPPPTVTSAAPGSSEQGTQPLAEASQPSAQSSNDRAHRGETAKSSDAPMKSMSKNEESQAMPEPGQANDHSTVAEDPTRSSQESKPSQ